MHYAQETAAAFNLELLNNHEKKCEIISLLTMHNSTFDQRARHDHDASIDGHPLNENRIELYFLTTLPVKSSSFWQILTKNGRA